MDTILQGLCPQETNAPRSADESDRLVRLDDLVIRTKEKELVRFEPNQVQVKYLDELVPRWREGHYEMRGLREIILKARQFGFSTLIEALFFCVTVNEPNTTTVVMAHDAETTEKLFRMVRLFYEHLPPHKKPRSQYASRREFYWPDINSSFYIGTAGATDFGRSSTINNLHCSEVAFYPDAETLMTGLLNAVPESGNVFLETTANGVGDFFHEEFERADSGESTFTSRFFAWFEHPEYRRDPERAPKAKPGEEEEEDRLRHAYGLSDEQIAWRRWKLREPGMGPKFRQEYPSNPKEAFLSSGNPYFDRDALDRMLESAPAPIDVEIPERFPLLRKYRTSLQVFRAPEPGRLYVIGADTAEGITDEGDHDYDSADVLDAETEEQVAHLVGRWDPHEYGLILADLGHWYETALLAVERNNHGHAVLGSLIHSAHYPPMSDADPHGLWFHAEFDERKRVKRRRPGWPTTPKTKFFALDTLATAVCDDDVRVNSRRTIGEMMTFVKLPGGKAAGENGRHDDCVISLSIAHAACRLRPKEKTGRRFVPAVPSWRQAPTEESDATTDGLSDDPGDRARRGRVRFGPRARGDARLGPVFEPANGDEGGGPA